MSRPKGSKNKRKVLDPAGKPSPEVAQWLTQKERQHEIVQSVVSPKKRESKKKILTTTDTQSETIDSLIGSQDVEVASNKDCASTNDADTGKLCGWINVCRADATRYRKEWYYIGGDIHDTKELAKQHASKTTIAQIYIEVPI